MKVGRPGLGAGWAILALSCAGEPPAPADRGGDSRPPPVPSADTGEPRPGPTDPGQGVLVVPDQRGLTLAALDGTVPFQRTWTELVGDCRACGGEGASADGDGLLVSFTTGGGEGGGLPDGAIARLTAGAELDFRVGRFGFPHDVIRDPADGTLMVVETHGSRVTWIDGTGASADPVRTLGRETEGFGSLPNGADLVVHGGRTFLMLTHRSGVGPPGAAAGGITLWDISEVGAPSLVWTFPPDGGLDIPHAPIFRVVEDRWWLLWAHTGGAGGGQGTVGLAVTDDPTVRPVYVADLEPRDDVAPFVFLRGVELTADGRLLLTDSGSVRGPGAGRVVEAQWPTGLAPAEVSGRRGDQVFVDLGPARVLLDDLAGPFEGWLWSGFGGLP